MPRARSVPDRTLVVDDPVPPAARARDVAVLALPQALPMEVGIPFQVLTSRTAEHYRVTLCGRRPGPVPTTGGFPVVAQAGLDAVVAADVVIVPAYENVPGQPTDDVLDALRTAHARGARVMSICVGAFALAAAGLLDGRRATTHWAYADRLAAQYPLVRVDPDVLFVDEGDVLTSAGVASGIDACLHLIRTDLGAAVANHVARAIVAAPHRDGGQAQFIARDTAPQAASALAATRAWALEHLHEPLTVADLARHARMSARTLARAFDAETGLPPLRWLTAARVDRARDLLERTTWSTDRIAHECGLGTAANMRLHFHRTIGVSPSDYRRTFTSTPA
ncbi:GlxA family transcriptional regulator [Cellulomonas palmilytica]|uniref:GlxA family transcriptional regulator n=1 Tax=Cellulomonas palmilytica TaxID=2608402 RepID=UPI001F21AB70|nr:helix-turn-helix domain-containing protein [Cellulomonas palmilytica]UJP40249.1 helix-turn-helix domain-containing protein [Cellulomonas palmilytica]